MTRKKQTLINNEEIFVKLFSWCSILMDQIINNQSSNQEDLKKKGSCLKTIPICVFQKKELLITRNTFIFFQGGDTLQQIKVM